VAEVEMLALAEKTYRAIGYFIFQFSQTEYSIRKLLGSEIELDEKFSAAVLQTFDVGALCNVSKEVFKITRSSEEAEELAALLNRFYKLNGERQRVAHGVWVPYFRGGMVQHVSRNSLKAVIHEDQVAALEKWAEEADAIRTGLMKKFIIPPPPPSPPPH
jgi:cysteinyl-tRNA synthetase